MGRRLIAKVIDYTLFCMLFLLIMSYLARGMSDVTIDDDGSISQGGSYVRIFLVTSLSLTVIAMCYEVSMLALRGGTLGKLFVGIRVVRSRDGSLPGWGPAAVRWIVPILAFFMTCGFGGLVVFLSPFFDSTRRNQGWHDQAAGTVVINI
jgi:uncharacterized RDD family membrane protein YckC